MAMYQFLIAVRSNGPGGNNPAAMLVNEAGEVTSHIQGMFNRTIKLMSSGVSPVYVFDGKPPQMKGGELAKRLAKRAKAETDLAAAKEAGEVDDVDKFSRRLVKVTRQHNEDCKHLLRLMGVPVVDAPCEAEAQCAELARKRKVYATATEDMDALTFRTPKLVRRLTFAQPAAAKDRIPILEIDCQAVLTGLELTYDQFVDLCIMCGCDYCSTIKGIGPKTALKLIKAHGSLENVIEQLRKEKKYDIPPDWYPQRVLKKSPEAPEDEEEDEEEDVPVSSAQENCEEQPLAGEVVDGGETATAVSGDAGVAVTDGTATGTTTTNVAAVPPTADTGIVHDVKQLDTAAVVVAAATKDLADENDDTLYETVPPLYVQARALFVRSEVHDGDTIELKWERPDEEALKEFLVVKMGFNPDRVNAGITKLKEANEQKSQKRLDRYVLCHSIHIVGILGAASIATLVGIQHHACVWQRY